MKKQNPIILKEKNTLLLIIGLAVIIHLIAFIYTLNNPDRLTLGDSFEYLDAAENLRTRSVLYAGDLPESPGPALYSRRPPLYPLAIATLYTFWNSQYLITLFQVGLTFLNVWLILRILTALEIRRTLQIITLAMYLFYPAQIIYSHLIMTEILFQALFTMALFSLTRYLQSKRLLFLLFMNLSLGLAVLTKPVLLYFWLPNLVFHFWLFRRNPKPVILVSPIILILVLALWSFRNYERTGYFHYSSIKNHNLLYYNTHSLLANIHGEASADSFIANVEQEIRGLSFAESNKRIEKICYATIRDEWLTYGIYHLRGMTFFFLDPGRFDFYVFLGIQKQQGFFSNVRRLGLEGITNIVRSIPIPLLICLVVVGMVNLAILIFFIRFLFFRLAFIEFKVFLLLTVLYVAAATGPIGASRFRLAIFPYLLMIIPILLNSHGNGLRLFKKVDK